jgi:oxygen-dependent protoporphyrinogen oxidase
MESDLDHDGKGYQVGYDEDLHTLGVSFNSLFDRDGLYTAFLGGMHEPRLVDDRTEKLGRIATREFETVTGASASVVDVARLDPGFPAWDESWWALEDIEMPDDLVLATNYTDRMGIPSRVREARDLAERLAERAGPGPGGAAAEPVTPAADD